MKDTLIDKLLVAVSGTGDVYTDARECRAQVAAAENLSVLAGILQANVSSRACNGTLFADGAAIGTVSVDIDGSLFWEPPSDFDSSEVRAWTVQLFGGETVAVSKFVVGDASDDERWVISDAQAFYTALLSAKRV
ncbi:MAG TPA: hypothetical protein VJP83_16655 [Terriglobales bacterium]|nr:hypothetical protein [Terriglobales bacterium]